jgi:O-antigen/teichoic acid export membrane protein
VTAVSSPEREVYQRSVLWVGGGIAVYGLASFAFLAIAGQALGEGPDYTSLAVLWTLLNAIGIGLYLPVEQESSRTISARRSLGSSTLPAIRAPLRYAVLSLVSIAGIAAIARNQIATTLFEGRLVMVPIFVLALAGMALAYLLRGTLAGMGRFPRYGTQLAVDGAIRVAGAAALLAGVHATATSLGLVLVAAPVIGTLVATGRPSRLLSVLPSGGTLVRTNLTPLVLASVASQALANAGPVAVQLLKTSRDVSTAGNLVNALTIARIPLFLFAAVQAVFLPALARHVALGARSRFVPALRMTLALTGGIGALGLAATLAIGPELVRWVFGPTFTIGRMDITLLALSAVIFMLAQVVIQALLAHGRDLAATVAWGSGLAALAGSLAFPGVLTTRVALALVVGSVVALAVSVLQLRALLGTWSPEEPDE